MSRISAIKTRFHATKRCPLVAARPGMEFRLQAAGCEKARRPEEFSTLRAMPSPHRLKPELHTRMRTAPPARSCRAFTLMEMMIAIMISGIALTAINSVLFGALHLRSRTIAITEQTLPIDMAVETMKRDLRCIVPYNINTNTSATTNLVGLFGTDALSVGLSQPLILELFTTTGMAGDTLPWGDVQKVDYWLQPSLDRNGPPGRNLVRGITRNLLPITTELPEDKQVLLQDVQRVQFSYYDGTNWNEVWSTTLSNIPVAIKASITFSPPQAGAVLIPPVQFVVPVVCTAGGTNQTSTNQTVVGN